jgi:esterase/lipase
MRKLLKADVLYTMIYMRRFSVNKNLTFYAKSTHKVVMNHQKP